MARGRLKLEDWQATLLAEQRAFRHRSRKRFPDPNQWLWTDKSLSQASDWWTACYKAAIPPVGTRVLDACCGAGADLVALAQQHAVTGIDTNERLLRLASANLKAHGLQANLISKPFLAEAVASDCWLHIDPDRRQNSTSKSGRTHIAEEFSPPLNEILPAALEAAGSMIKLAPKTEFSQDAWTVLDSQALRMWVGNFGECRQQIALLGQAILQVDPAWKPGSRRSAVVLTEPDSATNGRSCKSHVLLADGGLECPTTNHVAAFVYDLHAVLHASELQAAWAQEQGMQALGSPQGYFTSDSATESPWVQGFEVLDIISWDDRRVRRTLRGLDAGIIEVKNRLIRLDANQYQRKYSSPSGPPFTLLVTKLNDRVRAIVARRCSLST